MRTRLVLFQVGCCIKILLLYIVVVLICFMLFHHVWSLRPDLSRRSKTPLSGYGERSPPCSVRGQSSREPRGCSVIWEDIGRLSGRYVKISGLLKAIWGLNRHHPVRLVRFTAAVCSKVQETNLTSLKQVTCPGVGSQCLEKTWSHFKSEMFQTHVNSAWNQAWMQRPCGRWKMWISLSFAHQTLWSKLQQAAWILRVLERLGACNCDAEWPGGSRCVVAPRATLA